jgi:4-hydroxy 2-oxovalerate aldolase
MTAPVTIVDSTLRDGSHAKRHRFTVADVRAVAAALDSAGVPAIEISHGDGLGGSSYNYGFSLVDEYELLAAAAGVVERARLAVLLLPGIGVKEDLDRARELGASIVRVATHCTEADISESHLQYARELGCTAVGFLMMAHMSPPKRLAEQARIMAEAGAQVVYVTDSAGALLPDGVGDRVLALREALPEQVEVGFHGHQNLGLAVGNSLAAARAGATWIDGCAFGMGAGAGNAPTELLASAFAKAGVQTGVDPFAIMDVAAEIVAPILERPQVIDRASIVLGYAGVYSSFLLHAERAAARFGLASTDILQEAGRRHAVGGQEDLIVEIAAELAAR